MVKLHPCNNTVLCKQVVPDKEEVVENGIVFIKEQLPQYEVVEVCPTSKMKLNVGDRIITNSIPTRLVVDDGEYYIVKQEYIAGVVVK